MIRDNARSDKKESESTEQSKRSQSVGKQPASPYSQIMQLQRTIGNRAVSSMMQGQSPRIQRAPSEDYTNEADGTYWETDETEDHNGETVPSQVLAVMKNPDYGGTPSVDPPGWDWLKTKYGRLKGSWVRFHIINAELGGPGGDTTNLVPTTTALNHNAGWRQLEEGAKSSAINDDDWTYVEVDLNYNDDYPAGIPESISAEWGYLDQANQWRRAGTANLGQVNPDDNDNNHYLPAAQITNARLRQFGLNAQQAVAMRALIDDTYEDQDEFETELAGNGNHMIDENLIAGRWYDVAGRFYVDEDDDIDGPYPIVVRNA
ncbi:DNA/RNA non-specific endonuclease [Paenibacillus oryzisoli]|uniref:DNA/RNA non-specific endonuclease n=1 Tax=Paenibacillus oryzisoli TaxID=1850517 RepID=UPI003D2A514C